MIPYPCPSSDRWDALLHAELPAGEQAELDNHLEGCPECQRALEECAASRDVWAGARQLRRSPSSDEALRTVMNRLKGDPAIERMT